MTFSSIILITLLGGVLILAALLAYTLKRLKSAKRQVLQSKKALEEAEIAHTHLINQINERINEIEHKYSGLLSEDAEIARLKNEAFIISAQVTATQLAYAEKRQILERLEKQVAIYDERISFAELGVYEPHFNFDDSEDFKARILNVREQQKLMISAKSATICTKDWTVEGSKSKGQTMINRQNRLTLRAFNNECEAAIANARWNNVVAMEKRILAAEQAINKENSSLDLRLNDRYVALKIEELRLTHEYRERLKIENDSRLELAKSEREEKKLLAEAEAAEREEQKYQSLLQKARDELGTDQTSEVFKKRISDLEAALHLAHEASERARAMAEMTKSGYVYIISNIGSFGPDVVKIGLTRRLNPDDRVRELGDASVPFSFDTHAIIYSDEAPALEAALHREFENRRINISNARKEFFRVSLDEIETAVARLAPNSNFFKDREAQEWHETLARRNQMLSDMMTATDELPVEI